MPRSRSPPIHRATVRSTSWVASHAAWTRAASSSTAETARSRGPETFARRSTTVRDGTTIVATPFYLALQVTQRRGDDRARRRCAARRRSSRRPIRFHARAAHRRSRRTQGVQIRSAERHRSAGRSSLRHGTPASVRRAPPLTLTQGEVSQQITETARARAGLALVIALMCFVIGVWRATKTNPRRGGRARGRPRVHRARSAQPVLELDAALRPGGVLHARGGPLTGNAGRAGDDERDGAARRARGLSSRRTPHVALGRHRHHAGRRRPRSVSAARALARRAHAASRRRRVALADLGSTALSRRGVGAARRAPRRVPSCSGRAAARRRGSRRSSRSRRPCSRRSSGRPPAGGRGGTRFCGSSRSDCSRLSRRSRRVILSASTVAALGATTLVWGRTARGRVESAEHDLASLSQLDSVAATLLQRFGLSLAGELRADSRIAPRELRHVGHRRGGKSDHPLGLADGHGSRSRCSRRRTFRIRPPTSRAWWRRRGAREP